MEIKANDVENLLDHIDILEKDKVKYKKLWLEEKLVTDFCIDYAITQKKLHRHNHNHCVTKVIDSIPNENLLDVSSAFQTRLKEKLKDKPSLFDDIMNSMNHETLVKG